MIGDLSRIHTSCIACFRAIPTAPLVEGRDNVFANFALEAMGCKVTTGSEMKKVHLLRIYRRFFFPGIYFRPVPSRKDLVALLILDLDSSGVCIDQYVLR
jgi:hypothetical protein